MHIKQWNNKSDKQHITLKVVFVPGAWTRKSRSKVQSKRPQKIGKLLHGAVQEIPESLYLEINEEMIREATLRTKGSSGPSGVDANDSREYFPANRLSNLPQGFVTLWLL